MMPILTTAQTGFRALERAMAELGVVPSKVADTAHRWSPDGSVVPMMVVDVQPAVKGSVALAL